MDSYRTDVEELPPQQCWGLLGAAGIGRLAVVVEDWPEIFPINYAVDDATVVFRTEEGTKSARAAARAPVSLEVDGLDSSGGRAWSVVLKGRTEPVPPGHELMRILGLPLYPWHAGQKDRFVRVVPVEVTGRRFPVADPESWNSSVAAGRRTPSGPARWTSTGPDRD